MRVFVYKFKLNSPKTLLAYELLPSKSAATEVMLLAVGPHEDFYTGLKIDLRHQLTALTRRSGRSVCVSPGLNSYANFLILIRSK